MTYTLRRLGPHDAGPGSALEQSPQSLTTAPSAWERSRGPDGTTQLFSSYQEQGWTNSGTSGSPAAATLQAEAATTYTDPNGNTFQIRPDWMGLGQLSESTDAVRQCLDQRHQHANGLPDRLDRPARTGSPSTTTTRWATRPRSPTPT